MIRAFEGAPIDICWADPADSPAQAAGHSIGPLSSVGLCALHQAEIVGAQPALPAPSVPSTP